MKYIVKCSYCDHTYIIDSREAKENFECPKCAGQNGIQDVVERIQRPIILETRQPAYDPDVFKIPETTETPTSEAESSKVLGIVLALGIGVLGICMSAAYDGSSGGGYSSSHNEIQQEIDRIKGEAEANRDAYASHSSEAAEAKAVIDAWIKALNEKDIESLYLCYNIPFGSIYTKEDLEEWVTSGELKDMWGSDVDIKKISYDGYSASYADYYDLLSPYISNITDIYYDVTLTNGQETRFRFEKNISGQMKLKFWPTDTQSVTLTSAYPPLSDKYNNTTIDNHSLIGDCWATTDAYGQEFYKYNIPMIPIGDYHIRVETVLGTLSMPLTITMEDDFYDINDLRVDAKYKKEIATALQNIWNSVHDAAFNYAAPADFREFFDERITDEELDELTKQIRMEQDLRGAYEGASISKVTIPDGYFMAVNKNTFIVPVSMDYETANPEHASGTYTGKLTVTLTENGWQIYETYDNCFFTLATDTTTHE